MLVDVNQEEVEMRHCKARALNGRKLAFGCTIASNSQQYASQVLEVTYIYIYYGMLVTASLLSSGSTSSVVISSSKSMVNIFTNT